MEELGEKGRNGGKARVEARVDRSGICLPVFAKSSLMGRVVMFQAGRVINVG